MGGIPREIADAKEESFLWTNFAGNIQTAVVRGVEKPRKTPPLCHGCQQPLTREHRAFRRLALALVIALVSGLAPTPAAAENAPVVITEIAAFESSDHEWIEIFNRSEELVDISGWKFFEEGTNHGMSPVGGDAILDPGEYAIIADVATNFIIDYPDYDDPLFDSSWSTLNEDGEPIALKDATGAVVEMFTYLPTTGGSLQRIDVTKDDYTPVNWIEDENGPTPGAAYQPPPSDGGTGSVGDADLGDTEPVGATVEEGTISQSDDALELSESSGGIEETAEVQTELQNTGEMNESADGVVGSIVINEFVADPASGGHEWIELWNRTNFLLDLHSWKLEDGAGTIRTLDVQVGPGPHVIELTTSKLNNGGDLIVLSDALGTAIDTVAYGSWNDGNGSDNAPAPDDGQAVGRFPNAEGGFAVLSAPTPGAANAEPSAANVETTVPPPSTQNPVPTSPEPAPRPMVVISEIMPNPVGGDEGEWIELGNAGTAAADLSRWTISDGISTYYLDGRILAPGSLLVLPRSETNVVLENSGRENLTLRDNQGKIVAAVNYQLAVEGQAYALDEFGDWRWTEKPTPGVANEIISPNAPPVASAYAPTEGTNGELLLFDATDSVDPDGSHLTYRWDFGDGIVGEHPRLLHAFGTAGKHRIVLTVSDTDGATATKTVTVAIVATAVENKVKSSLQPPTVSSPAKTKVTKSTTSSAKTTTKEVRASGVIVALPGVLNKRSFLIETDSGPTEIYLHTASFPPLALGDRVSATGRWSEKSGLRRLIAPAAANIKVVESGAEPQPATISVGDLSPEDEGRLVSISGEIVEKTRTGLSLSDKNGEVLVAKPADGLPSDLAPGAQTTIIGIVIATPQGFKLLPRTSADIHLDSPPTAAEPLIQARQPPEKPAPWSGVPLAAAALGLSAGSAVLIRYRRGRTSPAMP